MANGKRKKQQKVVDIKEWYRRTALAAKREEEKEKRRGPIGKYDKATGWALGRLYWRAGVAWAFSFYIPCRGLPLWERKGSGQEADVNPGWLVI